MARNEFLGCVEADLRATAFPRPRDYVVSNKAICSPNPIPKFPKTSLQLSTAKQSFLIPREKVKKHPASTVGREIIQPDCRLSE